MKFHLSQRTLDQCFKLVVTIKGLDGILEIAGGVLLLTIPGRLHGWLILTTFDLVEDHHSFIAHALSHLDHLFTPGVALFGALYLLGHGGIKLMLMVALLRQHYRLYPVAIGFLLLFIFYQSYQVGLNHSAFLGALTAFDCILSWLIYLEWRRHTGPDRSPTIALPGTNKLPSRARQLLLFAIVSLGLVGSAAALVLTWPQAQPATAAVTAQQSAAELQQALAHLTSDAQRFQQRQQAQDQLTSPQALQATLDRIHQAIIHGDLASARRQISSLHAALQAWNAALDHPSTGTYMAGLTPPPGSFFIPIVLYHYPPENFEQQLAYLEQHGYTTVDLGQVAAALAGTGVLPPKPVVLTFDDGFANQMSAFTLLQQHHMKATFYIINGGPMSKWCIGAGRHYHDPLQPPQGCGDAYLSWDQVRQLDHSGLVTIGGHTLDHPNLPTLSADEQRHEIADSKAGIEQELGHPIYDFAYPYGNYNATTVEITKQAGYRTAVTTQPGDYQTANAPYTLHRLRDTLSLP